MSQAYDRDFLQAGQPSHGHDAGNADYITSESEPRHSFEDFLCTRGVIGPRHVAWVLRVGAAQGVSTIDVLLADDGQVADDLFRALAVFVGLPFLDPGTSWFRAEVAAHEVEACLIQGWVRLRGADGQVYIAAAPRDPDARDLRALGATGVGAGLAIDVVATPATIRQWVEAAHAPTLTDMAVNNLRRARPAASAHTRVVGWQKFAIAVMAVGLAGAALGLPWFTAPLVVFLSGMFLILTLVRLVCFFMY
ncbi:MAG: hypothetical protein ACTSUY_12855 [Alphaproteobacteria bacterium]